MGLIHVPLQGKFQLGQIRFSLIKVTEITES